MLKIPRALSRHRIASTSGSNTASPSLAAPRIILALVSLFTFVAGSDSFATTLPSEKFAERLVASGLASPTAMAFAPDGRLFVCLQAGQVRIIKKDVLLD